MKYLKNLLASFLIGVGIGSIIEIFISLAIGEITLGVPEFLNGQDSLLRARIIEIILYGGFGIVSFIGDKIIKEDNLLKASLLHFSILAIYFVDVYKRQPYYYVINEDGTKEIIKELTDEKVEKVEKKPVDKIILRGTKKVEKNKAPILEVKPSKEIDLGEKLDLKKLILKAFDPEDGEMIDKVVIDKGNFDNNKAGEYKIKFTLTDKDGLTTTALSTITVKEYKIEKEKEKDEKMCIRDRYLVLSFQLV